MAEQSIVTSDKTLVVTDLAVDQRLANIQKVLKSKGVLIERVSPFYDDWDYTMHNPVGLEKLRYTTVRNMPLRVHTWQPNRNVTTDEVQEHFKCLDADGSTEGLLTMLGSVQFYGCYVSISQDKTLLRYTPRQGRYYAPYFKLLPKKCTVGLYVINPVWKFHRYNPWIFVGFQKISAP